MNLRDLSDGELWIKTGEAARLEKQATLDLLEHLSEVQRRRLFALRGFGSLFEYIVKELGYSEMQASERIGALRLIAQVEEVKEKIQEGSLSLSTAAQIQRFVRSEKRHAKKDFSRTEKLALVAECQGHSKREVERILLQKTESPSIHIKETARAVSPELTELRFVISPAAQKMLEEVRGREGHDLSLAQIFERALASHLAKLGEKTEKPSRKIAFPGKSQATRYVRKAIRYQVGARSKGRCEYVDPLSGRRCESSYRLQLDHQIPFKFGGSNGVRNLRHLCPIHNQLQAIQIFGRDEMKRYVPDIE